MLRKITVVFGIIGYVLASLYVAVTVGILNLPDSFYFYNLGNFLLFKRYYSIFPFNAYYPNTTNAPLYGIIVRLISLWIPIAMTAISFTQLLLVGVSAYLIYLSANFVKRGLGWMAVACFIVLPFLLTYATVMMSEVFTIFLVSLYQYLAIGLITKRLRISPSVLILVACLLALTKFIFLYIIPVSIVLTLYIECCIRKKEHVYRIVFRQIPGVIGIVFIFLWMGFVHSYYGRWGMTVTTGRELFQGVVSKAGVFPSSDSPAYKTFQYWTGLEVVPRNGSDAIQKYFRPAFNEKKISEIEIDDMFRNFALAAMKQHLSYLFIDAFRGAYGLFTSHPYLECLRAGLGFSDSTCPDNPVLACRFQWFCTVGGCSDAQVGAMCQPVVKNAFMTSVWANLMSLYEGYYPSVMIGVLLLTVVGGITGFVRRSVSLMVVAFHFALLMGIQGMFSAVEGRYTMIVYPFIAILATYGARTIIDGVRRKLLIRR